MGNIRADNMLSRLYFAQGVLRIKYSVASDVEAGAKVRERKKEDEG